jgi:NAD+ synthase
MTEITCECIGCEIVKTKDLIRQTVWGANARGVVIGISGGLDSAVACSLCCKALSPERVLGVNMPVSSNNPQDHEDAEELCRSLGVELITVPLEEVRSAFLAAPHITDTPVLRGNIAARLRMTTLYNIAAARGYLVCGTSNKTEYMIGYSTKWGDSAADIQPLLHLWKKDVYLFAKELGVPESIITKAPSAGFWEGQSDESELGMSYAELDAALIALEESGGVPKNSIEEKALGFIKCSEHKRAPAANRLFT